MSIHIPSVDGDAEPAIVDSSLPEILPVLPLRDSVPFPDTLTPLAVGQERSVRLVNDVLGSNRMLVMVASKDPEDEEPGPDDLYRMGVAGIVSRMMKMPDGTLRILVHGAQRVEIKELRGHLPVPGRPGGGGAGHRDAHPRAGGAPPQRAGHLQPDRGGGALPPRGAAGGGREHRRPL